MKNTHTYRGPILMALLTALLSTASAQRSGVYRIGLFVPLHLDSAFRPTGEYRYGKSFPRQSLPGLEFYQGAEMAMDSLYRTGTQNAVLHVFDIRSANGGIGTVTLSPLMDSLDMLIGQVSGAEYLQLAQVARERSIPFVSATYPNDGGIKSMPNLVMVSPKLNSHLLVLHRHLVENSLGANVVWLRRKNPADNRPQEVFNELNDSPTGPLLKYRTVELDDAFTDAALRPLLDSTRENLVIAGSLDEGFARRLAGGCVGLEKTYPLRIVGMPTWEGISELRKRDYRPLAIEFTSSLYIPEANHWSSRIKETYRKRNYSRPSDLFFKGFLTTFHFVSLLVRHDGRLLDNLNDPSLKGLADFDFRPVRWSRSGEAADYYENKRIHVLRRQNGAISVLN